MADNSRVRVAEKSRRIGLTWTCACESVIDAAKTNGRDTSFVTYNQDAGVEFIRDCAMFARSFGLVFTGDERIVEDEDRDILVGSIKFASGHRIVALSSRPTNLRGRRGNTVLDEFAFHDQPEELLKAAMATLMWGDGRVSIVSTHNGVESHFNRIIQDIHAGKLPYSLHRIDIDTAIAQGLVERIFLSRGVPYHGQESIDEWRSQVFAEYGDDADEELRCIPARSGGTYIAQNLVDRQMYRAPVYRLEVHKDFAMWTEDARVAHVSEWLKTLDGTLADLPKNRNHFFGQDFGRVSDRSVIVIGYLDQDMTRMVPCAIEMLRVPYEQQKQVLFHVVDRLPQFYRGALDATGNGGYLAEVAMQRYGEDRIEQVNMTDKWYSENLPPLRSAFEDAMIKIPRDVDHLSDLAAFKTINGVPKLPKAKNKSSIAGAPMRHGDAGIAYALAYAASNMARSEYSYTSAKPTHQAGFGKMRGGLW
jgi:phage FluMu gp28-like protein